MHAQTHRCTYTKCAAIPTYKQTYKLTNTHTHTYKHTDIQTHKHTNTQTYKHTNIHTYKHTNANIHTYKHTHANIHTHTTCKHTNTQTQTNTHVSATLTGESSREPRAAPRSCCARTPRLERASGKGGGPSRRGPSGRHSLGRHDVASASWRLLLPPAGAMCGRARVGSHPICHSATLPICQSASSPCAYLCKSMPASSHPCMWQNASYVHGHDSAEILPRKIPPNPKVH